MYQYLRQGVLFIFIFILYSFIGIYAQVGINTIEPKATLDINGNLRIQKIRKSNQGIFSIIGIDENNIVTKENDAFTSWIIYLGFDPMASSHSAIIPFTLDEGYLYQIKGILVGACSGMLVFYDMSFIGERFLGATLQAVSSSDKWDYIYSPVTISAKESIFNISLEQKAGSKCTNGVDTGHFLTYNKETKQITVTFNDKEIYFPDAGTFAITSLIKLQIDY